jgi:hypothetical protein
MPGALPGCDHGFWRVFLLWQDLPRLQRPPKFSIVPAKRGQSGRGARCQAIYIVGYQPCSQNQGLSHQAREGNLLARDAAGCRASCLRQWLRHKTNLGRRSMRSRRDRAAFLPRRPPSDYSLGRIEAVQHRFQPWGKKSKISSVCFSGHVEVAKFCVNRCCKFVANAVSRVPSPTFQKKFTRWKPGGAKACSCRAVRLEIRARAASES